MTLGRVRSILVVAGVLVALASMAGVAMASGSAPHKKPVVHGKQLMKPPAAPVVHAASIHQASLPFTGADVILFLAIGLVLFAAGLMVYRRSRPSGITS
jgi:LPXTG-motif cell wall-anchored protein